MCVVSDYFYVTNGSGNCTLVIDRVESQGNENSDSHQEVQTLRNGNEKDEEQEVRLCTDAFVLNLLIECRQRRFRHFK